MRGASRRRFLNGQDFRIPDSEQGQWRGAALPLAIFGSASAVRAPRRAFPRTKNDPSSAVYDKKDLRASPAPQLIASRRTEGKKTKAALSREIGLTGSVTRSRYLPHSHSGKLQAEPGNIIYSFWEINSNCFSLIELLKSITGISVAHFAKEAAWLTPVERMFFSIPLSLPHKCDIRLLSTGGKVVCVHARLAYVRYNGQMMHLRTCQSIPFYFYSCAW